MAGGTGSRFWPLCDANHAKQFIDLMGTGETMLQSTFRHYSAVCARENIIIVTTATMEKQVREQLPHLEPYQVLCEPQRRNTAPCVAYAASVIDAINPHANVIVAPSDHAIFDEDSFQRDIAEAVSIADSHDWIVTLGAQPTNPNTKYGYIQFNPIAASQQTCHLHKVVTFTEKPPVEMAAKFISSGEFLWNSGIFIWNLAVLKKAYHDFLPAIAESYQGLQYDTPREALIKIYEATDAISVDYGIMEKATNVYCLKATFGWSDVETWDSLYGVLPKDKRGNAVASGKALFYDSKNTMVHLPEGRLAIVKGLDDYLISVSDGMILVCPRKDDDMLIRFAGDVAVEKSKTEKQDV